MNISRRLFLSGAVLLVASALPLTTLRAGADSPSPVTQMDDYLRGQRVVHTVETGGGDTFKGDGTEILVVKIYGVEDEARQTALCTALGALMKKSRVRGVTTLFFKSGPAGEVQRATYQPSMLPGGNASVEFAHEASASTGYRLQRTVKL